MLTRGVLMLTEVILKEGLEPNMKVILKSLIIVILLCSSAMGKDCPELMRAAGTGDIETVKKLIIAGCDINAKKSDGWTALMYGAGNGYTDIVKLLIDSGADVNAKRSTGKTALSYAKDKGDTQVIDILLKAGAEDNYVAAAGNGDPCPDITLPDVKTGKAISLRELIKGKVTVIIYIQTNSSACTKQLEILKNMLDDFPELNVIAISIDSGRLTKIQKYIDDYKFPFTFLHDPGLTTIELFGFSSTYAIAAIDKSGIIIRTMTPFSGGLRRNSNFVKILQKALTEK
jgi:ankyrin repeat protein